MPFTRRHCGLCGSDSSSAFARYDAFQVVRCDECHSGYVASYDRDRHQADYSSRYESEQSSDKAARCAALLDTHRWWPKTGRIFDVGCGGGRFLDLAAGRGLTTAGLELDSTAAADAARAGHEVQTGCATGTWETDGADLVTLWDLVEHLEEPGQALRQALSALSPGGRLVLVTPMMGSSYDRLGKLALSASAGGLPQLLRMCWSEDHLYRFDPRGIEQVLRGLGATEVTVEPILLLSLDPDRYAGGAVLQSWTGSTRLDGWISRCGVAAASVLQFHNKILVSATRR